MYDFSPYSTRQLLKEIKYQRQFAGVKGVSYHREYIQAVALEVRNRTK